MATDCTVSLNDALGFGAKLARKRAILSFREPDGTIVQRAIEGRTLVGSAAGVDLRLTEPTVSRLHAELEPQEDGLWVKDLGSRNGTYVENIRITAACLPAGATLRIGSTNLVVTYDQEPLVTELWPTDRFGSLVGASRPMRALFARISRVARTMATVLIEGESGTGKELAARAIHEFSPRAQGPFVIVDCGALPENLLDAELFGHTKSAFTGASNARAGAVEAAHGGTLFLDEIGELPLPMQPKLLRVLESRTVRRLGDNRHQPVDVRFIAATHRDLKAMVNQGEFREDLYFRLAVVPLRMPSLRERPEDIVALMHHLLPSEVAGTFSPEHIRELVRRPWPGNVRELRNFLERAVALGAREAFAMESTASSATTGVVSREPVRASLPPEASDEAAAAEEGSAEPGTPGWKPRLSRELLDLSHDDARNQAQRDYLQALLERHGWNVAEAASAAQLNRTYLYRLISRHKLRPLKEQGSSASTPPPGGVEPDGASMLGSDVPSDDGPSRS